MQRREFIAVIGGVAATWPLRAHAQQSGGTRQIGVLMGIGEDDPEAKPRADALRQGLEARGWRDGRNIRLHFRWTAGDLDRTSRLAREIVDLKPDLIVVHSTPAVKALQELNTTAPMVFALVADPLGSGFAVSLARPGRNMTGFMNVDAPMASKWLELITEIVPNVKRVALIYNPNTSPYQSYLREFEVAAPRIGVEAVATPVVDATELERAITALGQQPNSALFVVPDIFVQVHRALIIRLAERYRLPGIYPYRFFPTSGGLMSYGIDTVAVFTQAAAYVDRILKGEKPSDLPVQAPVLFKLVVNLKAARAIGLTIPESFLLRADEVIE